ncbi:MFS transporter [Lentzea aerocolonigenes]|uniref:MFS transporter n=1 Tax=Lentzea aerocolonigenes TaxID=68170 RepID=UPI0004C3A690|nr:MFS transporter [Lentzea aerocolonigenes]MCP2243411.1 putative arabinose efflux permease, MFS family [Lentzea aerocolonigenes]
MSKSLWRNRNFMLLWSGQTISETGSAVTEVALPLVAVLVLGAGAFETGLLKAAAGVAFVLIALPAGAIVDGLRKRKLMLWCDVARFGALATIPLLAWTDHLEMWHLYVVAAVAGVLTVFFDVAYQSYIAVLLPPEHRVDGNGKLGSTQYLAYVGGTSLGGGLAALLGATKAVAVDALSFVVSAVSLAFVRFSEPAPARPEKRDLPAEIAEGLGFVLREPLLRRIVCCTATSNLGISMAGAINVIFLVQVLQVPTGLVGLLLASGTVGGVLGGLVAGRIAARFGSARVIWASFLGFGWTGLLVPLAEPGWRLALFAIGWSVFSAAAVVYNSGQMAYRQAVCPPELLGRMNASIRWIVWGIGPLGALIGGSLGSWIGIRPTLWLAMACIWSAGLWVYFSPLRAMRDVPLPRIPNGVA